MRQLPQPGEPFGRYQILDRIGRGGMGVVYAARQPGLNREVALKVLLPDLADSEDYRNRFIREAESLARLESPHVISIYDAGEIDGWLYLATQMIADGDLAQALSRGPLEPGQAVDVLGQVAAGLADAHAIGILHRDIKPSNVLLRRKPDGSLHAYLCDFGVAKDADSDHATTVNILGTAGYLAPERHRGEDATEASDVYALGCLLWAALTGRAPYEGTGFAIAQAHLSAPIPQLGPEVRGAAELNPLIAAAMAKDPAQRFHSASALRGALQHAAGRLSGGSAAPLPPPGQAAAEPTRVQTSAVLPPPPVRVLPEPPRDQTRSPERAWIALAVVVVLLACAGAAWAIWGRDRDAASVAGNTPPPSTAPSEPLASSTPTEEITPTPPSTDPSPVAAVVGFLSGRYLSYDLSEDEATCVAEAYLQYASPGDTPAFAAELGDRWPELPGDEADVVAQSVLSCSTDVPGRLFDQLRQMRSDVFEESSAEYDACVRDDLDSGELADLLGLELSGAGRDVYDAFDSGSMSTCYVNGFDEDEGDGGFFG